MARNNLPIRSNPNTSRVRRDKNGNIIQKRFYAAGGWAIKNVDYSNHYGHPNPHVHDWVWKHGRLRRMKWRHPNAGEQL
jgi:hypothetical protein